MSLLRLLLPRPKFYPGQPVYVGERSMYATKPDVLKEGVVLRVRWGSVEVMLRGSGHSTERKFSTYLNEFVFDKTTVDSYSDL